MSFRIRIWTAEGEENQNKNRYKPNIDRPLKCCSTLMQFFQACSHLPSTFNVHTSFACFHRQSAFARISSDQRRYFYCERLLYKNRLCILFHNCLILEVRYRWSSFLYLNSVFSKRFLIGVRFFWFYVQVLVSWIEKAFISASV